MRNRQAFADKEHLLITRNYRLRDFGMKHTLKHA